MGSRERRAVRCMGSLCDPDARGAALELYVLRSAGGPYCYEEPWAKYIPPQT